MKIIKNKKYNNLKQEIEYLKEKNEEKINFIISLFKEIVNDQTDIRIDEKNRIYLNGLFLGKLEAKED